MAATGSAQYAHISIQALFPVGGAPLGWVETCAGRMPASWITTVQIPLGPHCKKHLKKKSTTLALHWGISWEDRVTPIQEADIAVSTAVHFWR